MSGHYLSCGSPAECEGPLPVLYRQLKGSLEAGAGAGAVVGMRVK